jgi:uncharacterized membrane protein
MASHWNVLGEVDGYISRFWGVFLLPLVSFLMFLFFLVIPRIDPLKANIAKFRKYFDGFIVLITLFLLGIYKFSLLWNLGTKLDILTFLPIAIGILFYYCGVLTENAKRNWFIGIRTPWTMSSDAVWEKTHRLGGKLFKASGIIAVLGIFFRDWAFYFTIIPALFTAIYSSVYSYLEFRHQSR